MSIKTLIVYLTSSINYIILATINLVVNCSISSNSNEDGDLLDPNPY